MKTMITTITLAAILSLSHWVEANAAPGVFLVAAKPGVFATALDLETLTAETEAVQS